MKPELWPRMKAIFAEATRFQNPAERRAFVEKVCQGQDDLKIDVTSLLAHHTGAPFLGI